MHVDPECPKKDRHLALLGPMSIKAARKNVGEIDTWFLLSLSFPPNGYSCPK